MKITLAGITAVAALAVAASVSTVTPATSASNAFVVTNAATKTECSACHVAYAPGFLPKRSWQAIMSDLGNHFGEDASLDPATTKEITNYLMATAPQDIRGVSATSVPLRITKMTWFTRQHGQRAIDYAKSRANIGTISNCTGCHRGAERGIFGDD